MSDLFDLTAQLDRWRERGSLRYLAHHLGVTSKQVTRYFDNRWIPGWYRTPKGHRRICYRDDTVARVRLNVRAAKETNINIRYYISAIPYRGIVIPTKGCHSMNDLYRKARRSGLTKCEASEVANKPRPLLRSSEIWWDALHAIHGTSPAEAAEMVSYLDCIPLASLLAMKQAEHFRRQARSAWRAIVSRLRGRSSSMLHPLSLSDKERQVVRKLLSQPDRRSFLSEWSKVTEVENRIIETDARACIALKNRAEEQPARMRLETAVLRLKHFQRKPTVAELAKLLGKSRCALYREFGARELQEALNLVRTDAMARNQKSEPARMTPRRFALKD
jgi:hypothetical protein